MSTQNTNITEKNIKLSIQVSLAGLFFAVLIHSIIPLLLLMKCILILSIKKLKLRIYFQMRDYPELKETYDDVLIIQQQSVYFVPARSLMRISWELSAIHKVLKLIFLRMTKSVIIRLIYIPYVNMNNFFIDQFGTFDYKHANSILITTFRCI
jgi:hypothetical protein